MKWFPALLGASALFFGLLALVTRHQRAQKFIVIVGATLQIALSILFAILGSSQLPLRFVIELAGFLPELGSLVMIAELAIATLLIVIGIAKKNALAIILASAQFGLAILSEALIHGVEAETHFVIDQFGIVMTLIIGVIGSLIVIYSVGYMSTYHKKHPDIQDRRPFFSFVFFAFLAAMYGLIYANDLRLMLLFWELTTLASFFLIGYSKEKIAVKNSFLALNLNLVGGLAFAVAIILVASHHTVELDALLVLVAQQASWTTFALPLFLLALAGIAKSALFPFTPWLLGAMVAPTPVSALLHSSTMVKAGVFLLIRLSPAFFNSPVGYLVSLVGIISFLLTAFAAISQRNSKRVLALSTVSNLGLIAACAGYGAIPLVWAAIFLVIFHACAKALLFMIVGSVSFRSGSLDIEDQGALITTMPRTSAIMIVGICVMFIAPFGMLISKWTAMEVFARVDSIMSPLMVAFLAFGSAATLLFWTKWLGVLVRIPDPEVSYVSEDSILSKSEFRSELILAIMCIAACFSFPFLSKLWVEPWIVDAFGTGYLLDSGNVTLMLIMLALTLLLPAFTLGLWARRNSHISSAYMGGRVTGPGLSFKAAGGDILQVEGRAYYLEGIFGETRILKIGIIVGIVLLAVSLGIVTIPALWTSL